MTAHKLLVRNYIDASNRDDLTSIQVSDSTDWSNARGLPFAFRRRDGSTWVPANSQIVGS